MSTKYDVYKDSVGDWVITPADGDGLNAPAAIACVNGAVANTFEQVVSIVKNKPREFKERLRVCHSQSVIDHFGPYQMVDSFTI